jgi:lysophospholipase L1-like esterase
MAGALDIGCRQRPGALLRYANGTTATANARGYRGPLIRVPKPVGTFRVVLLGESTTHGWGMSDEHRIDAYLRHGLADQPWLADQLSRS